MAPPRSGTLCIVGRITLAVIAALACAGPATALQPVLATSAPGVDTSIGAAPAGYVALTPCRLVDTRTGFGVQRLDARTLRVQVGGACGVDSAASAVALTITITGANRSGYARAWPAGTVQPFVSSVNWLPGQTRANTSIVSLHDGAVDVSTNTAAQIVVDVSGAFIPMAGAHAGRYVPIDHTRLLDTRTNGAALGIGGIADIALPDGVPADASALAITVTATNSDLPGFFTAWARGTQRPLASVLNTDAANETRAASLFVPVSNAGFSVYSSGGADVIVDISGYFTGASATDSADGLFRAVPQRRVIDTRQQQRMGAGSTLTIDFATPGAASIVANWTMVAPDGDGYIALDATSAPRSGTSAVNATPGEAAANLAVTRTALDGIAVYTSVGSDVVADIQGFFTGDPAPARVLPYGGVSPFGALTPGPRSSSGRRVMYLGDSLGTESQDALIAALSGWRVDVLTFGGTAPCDWLQPARDAAALLQPDVVVFTFLGNSLTACTGYQRGDALLASYDRDLHEMCASFLPARCVAVGQPSLGPNVVWSMPAGDQPTSMYRAEAERGAWGFVDAGASVDNPDGSLAPQYRSADGVHFTIEGGNRFASAIATYLHALLP